MAMTLEWMVRWWSTPMRRALSAGFLTAISAVTVWAKSLLAEHSVPYRQAQMEPGGYQQTDFQRKVYRQGATPENHQRRWDPNQKRWLYGAVSLFRFQ